MGDIARSARLLHFPAHSHRLVCGKKEETSILLGGRFGSWWVCLVLQPYGWFGGADAATLARFLLIDQVRGYVRSHTRRAHKPASCGKSMASSHPTYHTVMKKALPFPSM